MPMVKARKRHRCMVCQMPIEVSTTYVCITVFPDATDNDAPWDYKAHTECNDLFQRFGDDSDWMFPYYADDWQAILDDHGVTNPHPWDERVWQEQGGTA